MRLKTIRIPPRGAPVINRTKPSGDGANRPSRRTRGDTWHDAVDPFENAYSTWLHEDLGVHA